MLEIVYLQERWTLTHIFKNNIRIVRAYMFCIVMLHMDQSTAVT